jgi:hypothetical protein
MRYSAVAPMLRAHQVTTLADRVVLLRKLVWFGATAFDPNQPPAGSLQDPNMRQIGLEITQPCRGRDDMCELHAIYWFTKHNTRYTGDITNKDTFQSAWRTLQYGGGDCDDHAVQNAVLAMVNGFETRFRITSNTGASWDHIYLQAGVPKTAPRRWVTLDTTLPGRDRFDIQPPFAKKEDFPVTEPRR